MDRISYLKYIVYVREWLHNGAKETSGFLSRIELGYPILDPEQKATVDRLCEKFLKFNREE